MTADQDIRTDLVVRREGRAAHEAPTLLFLHGLTDSGSAWPDAVARWGGDYSILTLDLRGHGDSPQFTEEQLEAHPGEVMVDDVVAILEQLGQSPVVIGHSLGGAVALAAAARRPDLVRGLVLEDPAPLGPGDPQRDPSRGEEFLAGIRESLDAADENALLGLRTAKHPTWSEAELRATGEAEQKMDLDYLAHGDIKPVTAWPELFEALTVSALVVSGDDMAAVVVNSDVEDGIAEIGNPNVSLVRVEGSGHCVRREQPDKYYEVVSEFLTSH